MSIENDIVDCLRYGDVETFRTSGPHDKRSFIIEEIGRYVIVCALSLKNRSFYWSCDFYRALNLDSDVLKIARRYFEIDMEFFIKAVAGNQYHIKNYN